MEEFRFGKTYCKWAIMGCYRFTMIIALALGLNLWVVLSSSGNAQFKPWFALWLVGIAMLVFHEFRQASAVKKLLAGVARVDDDGIEFGGKRVLWRDMRDVEVTREGPLNYEPGLNVRGANGDTVSIPRAIAGFARIAEVVRSQASKDVVVSE